MDLIYDYLIKNTSKTNEFYSKHNLFTIILALSTFYKL